MLHTLFLPCFTYEGQLEVAGTLPLQSTVVELELYRKSGKTHSMYIRMQLPMYVYMY